MKQPDHENREHHAEMPPSALPALDKCPCYLPSGTVGAAAKRGTKLHEQLEEILTDRRLRKSLTRKDPSK